MNTIETTDHNILREDRVADPYEYFAYMRAEHPVHWNEEFRAWFVYRHTDVTAALRNPALSSDRIKPIFESKLTPQQQRERKPTFDILGNWMVFMDPPDHTRLRKMVMPAFAPKAVERMRPRVESVVRETLDRVVGRTELDLVEDVAYPIPAVVIAELMGVPPEDRDLFKRWSDQILVLVFGARGVEGRRAEAQQGLTDLADYLRELIATFRKTPGDNLISALLAADEDAPLTDDEIVSTCVLLVFGGHETTTNLIANGTKVLLEHPHQLARLRADRSLIRGTVEELLRFDGPSKMEMRRVIAPVDLGGQTLGVGEQVYLVQGSANRDDAAFESPETFDITRTPNRHVGFGFGLHHCLGNFLARLEASVAIESIVDRLPGLVPATTLPHWHPTLISRGMTAYPVRVES